MHEFGITQAIVRLAVENAPEGATRAVAVNLTVGRLSGALSECVEMYFDALTEGGICENAKLRIRKTDGRDFFVESVEYGYD